MSAAVDLSALKSILLLETYVAGLFAHERTAVAQLHAGQSLRPVREATNDHDSNAIALETTDGLRVGYVPKSENVLLARLMDAGKELDARIADVSTHGMRIAVELHIFLRDR
jgi:hypothetical protein